MSEFYTSIKSIKNQIHSFNKSNISNNKKKKKKKKKNADKQITLERRQIVWW